MEEVICGQKIPSTPLALMIRYLAERYSKAVKLGNDPDLKDIRATKQRFKNFSFSSEIKPFKRSNVFMHPSESKVDWSQVIAGTLHKHSNLVLNKSSKISNDLSLHGHKNSLSISTSTRVEPKEHSSFRIHPKQKSSEGSPRNRSKPSSIRNSFKELTLHLEDENKDARRLGAPNFQRKSQSQSNLNSHQALDTPQENRQVKLEPMQPKRNKKSLLTDFFLTKTKPFVKSSHSLIKQKLGMSDSQQTGQKKRRAGKHICFKSALPDLGEEESEAAVNDNYCEIADFDINRILPSPVLTRYLDKNNFCGMVEDSLYSAVKRHDRDLAKEGEVSQNINRRFLNLNWQFTQGRSSYKFVRKCLKTKHMNQIQLKADDYMPLDTMELRGDEERQKVIVHRKMREQEEKAENEKRMFDALGDMVNDLFIRKMNPARKLQQIIFDHKHELNLMRVFTFWKGLDKDPIAKANVEKRVREFENRVSLQPLSANTTMNKKMIKETMTGLQDKAAKMSSAIHKSTPEVHFSHQDREQARIKSKNRANILVSSHPDLLRNVKEYQIKNLTNQITSIFDIVKQHKKIVGRQHSLDKPRSPYSIN